MSMCVYSEIMIQPFSAYCITIVRIYEKKIYHNILIVSWNNLEYLKSSLRIGFHIFLYFMICFLVYLGITTMNLVLVYIGVGTVCFVSQHIT